MATQLVALPEVERLSASVIRILGANPGKFTLQGTNTYLVGRGYQRILIDTGQGEEAWAKNLQTVLTDENATVHQALLTHWHGDHVGGVADLQRLCPQVQVFKCPTDLEQDYATIVDGQVFGVEGATLKALFTPGHTEDHMAFVLEEEDAMFTGDNVLGHGTAVFENLRTYLASLHRMRERVRGRGYPGHGAVVENAPARIQEYIQHRQQREDEVIRVLRYGQLEVPSGRRSTDTEPESRRAWTPLQLVQTIYVGVPETLHLPASHGISLVLEKLQEEGKTVQDESGAWRLVGEKSTL